MYKMLGLSAVVVLTGTSSVALAQSETDQERAGTTDTNTTTDSNTRTREYEESSDTGSDTNAPRGVVRAPAKAFELGVEGGYTQPFGSINGQRNIEDVANAGGAVGVTASYRFNPRWSLGVTGQFHESDADDSLGVGAMVRGVAAGLLGTFHIMPYSVVDPYASLGTGYRAMWIAPTGTNNNDMIHGFELGKAELGVDFRVSKDIAIGPMVGADVDVFLWDNPQATEGNTQITGPHPTTFIFGGAAARFDMGGKRVPEYRRTAAAPAPTPAAAPAEPRPVHPVEETPPPPPSTGVTIAPNILEQCHIEGPKAFFEFDKSNLKADYTGSLDAVAACFTSGPLQGRTLYVVGHADPRGSDQYNMILGESRSESVGTYLQGHGMPQNQLIMVSRGERDATGKDENGWAFDRRVDLRLEQ